MKRGWGWVILMCLGCWIVPSSAAFSASGTEAGDFSASATRVFMAAGEARTADGTGAGCGPSRLGVQNMAAFYGEYDAQRNESAHSGLVGKRRTAQAAPLSDEAGAFEESGGEKTSNGTINDPLEPMNRAFYHFNDKLYFWFLKPVGQGYRAVVPETARVGVRNVFTNLAGPVRIVNCLLQGKGEEAGYEFVRLFMNTIVGLGGLLDVASDEAMDLERYDEDLGQTLGFYGWDASVYLHWPFLGPSSERDTLGRIGDGFLDPMNYLVPQTKYNIAVRTSERVNEVSLTIGDYEDLKRSALDPYVAIRDAYYQYRRNSIQE